MKRFLIFLAVFSLLAWGLCHGSGFNGGGGGSSSTVDNGTIDSRIDQTISNPSTTYYGDGSNLTGVVASDNETKTNRLIDADHADSAETITGTLTTKSVTPKALADALGAYTHDIITSGSITGGAISGTTGAFSGAVTGTTVTASGAVTGTSVEVTRGNYAQCVQLFESLSNDNESTRICAPLAQTDTYKITLPAAKMTAINQSFRCSSITGDNCTLEFFTPLASTALDDNASHTVDSINSTTTIPTWRAMIAWVGSFFERRTLYQVDNATALRCGGYYDSNASTIFPLPTTVYDGCEAFLSEYPGKTNVIQANPGATGYISNQANTGWCTQGQTLDSGGAATDKLGVVADNNGTITRWLIKSATGTWTCTSH